MSTALALTDLRVANDSGRHILVSLLAAVQVGGARELADAMLSEFGSLARILGADRAAQKRVIGDQPDVLGCLSLVREAMLHSLVSDIQGAPILNNTEAVVRYLQVAMAHETREQVRVLFLDASLHLIRDEVTATGTVRNAPVYPREIMRRALELGASNLVLAHNHPSGNLEPSRCDIQATRQIVEAGRALEVSLLDHLIITRYGHTSFRSVGLI